MSDTKRIHGSIDEIVEAVRNIDRMFERLKEEKELLSEISALRAEVERLKECEAIVRELAESGLVTHYMSHINTARQWVRDNRHTPGDDGGNK